MNERTHMDSHESERSATAYIYKLTTCKGSYHCLEKWTQADLKRYHERFIKHLNLEIYLRVITYTRLFDKHSVSSWFLARRGTSLLEHLSVEKFFSSLKCKMPSKTTGYWRPIVIPWWHCTGPVSPQSVLDMIRGFRITVTTLGLRYHHPSASPYRS
jgi:hypothetical protein